METQTGTRLYLVPSDGAIVDLDCVLLPLKRSENRTPHVFVFFFVLKSVRCYPLRHSPILYTEGQLAGALVVVISWSYLCEHFHCGPHRHGASA